MSNPLRILLIEDNPDDRLLTLRALRKEYPDIEAVEVLDDPGFMQALELDRFDLAITDYQLLWSTGQHAMTRFKQRHAECPVIMFTDSGSEEVAVQALKTGLDDYIRKTPESFTRLASSARNLVEGCRDRKRSLHMEVRLQDLLSRLQVGVCRSYMDGNIIYANTAFLRIFGLPADGLSRPINLYNLLPRSCGSKTCLEELIRKGRLRLSELLVDARGARSAWFSVTQNLSTAPDGSYVVETLIEDISERKRLEQTLKANEEELRQLQKMESIGRLAGGVAHDFNNLLTAINGYSELLMEVVPKDDPIRSSVIEINKAGTRAAALTHELLAFSSRQMLWPRELDLNALIRKKEDLLRKLLGERHELRLDLDEGSLMVKCDPDQMESVLIKLASNARDAMPEPGRLLISTARQESSESTPGRDAAPEREPGDRMEKGFFAALHVEDTGTGMDEITLKQIFEPFYTTKAMGKGTGMGLSTVYGVISQTGGHISVESRVGKGTRFRITLPCIATALSMA